MASTLGTRSVDIVVVCVVVVVGVNQHQSFSMLTRFVTENQVKSDRISDKYGCQQSMELRFVCVFAHHSCNQLENKL